jgi:uncharacterized peroxidase-related enzyme
MSRLNAVDYATSQGQVKQLLDAVKAKLGVVPNLMKTVAQSPAALAGYLGFNGALQEGSLSPKLREQIALEAAEYNGCEYCLSAHTLLGKHAGLTPEEISGARDGSSADAKTQAALTLVRQILKSRGRVADAEVAAARSAGFSEGDIAEIVGHVALNVFTNYFNNLAGTPVDFPVVKPRGQAVGV